MQIKYIKGKNSHVKIIKSYENQSNVYLMFLQFILKLPIKVPSDTDILIKLILSINYTKIVVKSL